MRRGREEEEEEEEERMLGQRARESDEEARGGERSCRRIEGDVTMSDFVVRRRSKHTSSYKTYIILLPFQYFSSIIRG